MSQNENLPPLPQPVSKTWMLDQGGIDNRPVYTADQMREYAIAARKDAMQIARINAESAQALAERPMADQDDYRALKQICDEKQARIADLEAFAEGLQAGADSLRASRWLPIADAPKDKDVFLATPQGVRPGFWLPPFLGEGFWMAYGVGRVNPTHYMPIPPLPEVKP